MGTGRLVYVVWMGVDSHTDVDVWTLPPSVLSSERVSEHPSLLLPLPYMTWQIAQWEFARRSHWLSGEDMALLLSLLLIRSFM